MNQADIDKLLAIREAWDKYKSVTTEKTAAQIDDYYGVVWSYGIERRDEIEALNDALTMQWIKENLTMHGECDKCEGYKDTPPCNNTFGEKGCFTSGIGIDPQVYYYAIFKGIRLGLRPPVKGSQITTSDNGIVYERQAKANVFAIDGDKIYLMCPVGHGYYHDYFTPVEKAPFALYWTP
jgi:hypothetical protein